MGEIMECPDEGEGSEEETMLHVLKDKTVEKCPAPAAPPIAPEPPLRPEAPDGGWGWVVVAASFTMGVFGGTMFVAMSILYIELTDYFQSTKGNTGWIASLFIFSGFTLSPVYGALLRLYGHRKMTIIGGAIFSSGFLMSFFAPNIAFLYISCGLVAGIGRGIVQLSSVVIIQQYFSNKRALAAGLAGCGVSVGTLLSAPIVQLLLDNYGLRGTFLILSGLCLHDIPLGGLLRPLANARPTTSTNRSSANPRQREGEDDTELNTANVPHRADTPKRSKEADKKTSIFHIRQLVRDMLDFSLMRDIKFLLYLISAFLLAIGLGIYIQHTPSRAAALGIELHLVSLLPTIMGISSLVGRVFFSALGNVQGVDRIMMFPIMLLALGIIHALYFLCKDFIPIAIHVGISAVFSGGILAIIPTTLTDLMGVENITKSYSLISVFTGIAMLFGIPFAGFIFDVTGDYSIPFYIGGSLEVLGALVVFPLLLLRHLKTSSSSSGAECGTRHVAAANVTPTV